MNRLADGTAGEGWIALSLALIVAAVWLFPIPLTIYLSCLQLFIIALWRASLWLRELISTWPRLAACAVAALAMLVGFFLWQKPEAEEFFDYSELKPAVFAYWAVLLAAVELFWLVVDALKRLWRERRRQP